jgi:hypothetical protein
MTINLANNNPRISYSVAQGATQQTFAVPFEFFNDSDITVYVDGVLKTEGSDYTLTGGDGSTGNVVFVTATPPAVQQVLGATGGSTVVIFRTTDIERTSDFSAGSDINRAALNEQLDILTAMIADQNDKTDRTIRLNDYETAPSLILPSIANRKGKVLAFNATTGAVEEGPTTDSIVDVNSYVATASAAATSATASASSATASAASATASATSAAASLDSFDDRYLGAKTSNPTLDNDGNALLTGALYFDSVNNLMKVYNGSAWGALLVASNNLSDLSNVSTARTNLGLGTIATQTASSVTITGGSITGITDLTVADGGTGASDAAGARSNLGLGTISTQAASSVAITGGTINGTTFGATTPATASVTTLTVSSSITETIFALTGTTPALSAANGTIQTWTLTGNSTPTDSLANGQSITLLIDDGTAYTITWPSVTWKTNSGVAPILNTTGFTVIVLWEVGGVLYGARVGDA